ncbi:hypothetical protein Leryth_005182 [Lithospermum erythrorhizon]|nr:hypothetical protein Leryth_005182 [Lithospermum erythrorhizon]
MTSKIHLLFCLYFIFFIKSNAFNITAILNQFPAFSTFNSYLTQTQVASAINSKKSVTVLAVDNNGISSLSGKPADVLGKIMSLHAVLDYYDVQKLQNIQNRTTILTSLYQAPGQRGFLNATILNTGSVVISSVGSSSIHGANLVKSIFSEPYNLSILQVSTVVAPMSMVSAPSPPKIPPQPPAPPSKQTIPTRAVAATLPPIPGIPLPPLPNIPIPPLPNIPLPPIPVIPLPPTPPTPVIPPPIQPTPPIPPTVPPTPVLPVPAPATSNPASPTPAPAPAPEPSDAPTNSDPPSATPQNAPGTSPGSSPKPAEAPPADAAPGAGTIVQLSLSFSVVVSALTVVQLFIVV